MPLVVEVIPSGRVIGSGMNLISLIMLSVSCIFFFFSLYFFFVDLLQRRLCVVADVGADDIELVHGMPIGLQIVGGRFGEEKAVAVAKVVDELMNPTPFHPFS